ncbi:MAG: prepilin-type N-terminal cleavage/methylation domain-containing protein [Verrucomicrobia bacterium]|jgi:prepilin-type N-terminal cleavage/methylation domain-containing protein|nr:prepilin-type N-terminal cleavage/methylation domain-containing protein [Verrucomicrobiota bacterium]|tara:strand:- start:48345 stop:49265 length:921 start_codon:yes stop_codon:yes gene_type:complete
MKGILDIGNSVIGVRNNTQSSNHPVSQSPYPRRPVSRRDGFTLLELVIALLLIALLVGMVFSTARSSLILGNSVVQTQNEEMLHQAFFELLEKRFAALPGNTRMDLVVTDGGSHYITDLTLEQVPLSFTWGGQERTAKAIQLSTVKRRSGFLDIVLRYYENEIIDPDSTTGSGFASSADEEPFAEIILLTDVAYFEWRALDGRTMEYQYDWDLPGRLPLQMELSCKFGASGEEIRQIFWIPPRQNPEVFMRQLQQSAGQGGGGTTNPGNGTDVEIPNIEINPRPGGRSGGGQENNNLPPGVTPPGK